MKSITCMSLIKQAAQDSRRKLTEEAAEWSLTNAKDYAQDYDHDAFRHAYEKYNERNRNVIQDSAHTLGDRIYRWCFVYQAWFL